MKFQPKRFVVEVKRGTNRASFASPDVSTDRFSGAEAALFGPAGRAEASPAAPGPLKAEVPSGRVLRSLVEPPPPVAEEPAPPARRGRKPGSKNKPKAQSEAPSDAAPTAEAHRPRRGRKPGSKNKPKTQIPTASPPASSPDQGGGAAAMRSYGFADDGTAWTPSHPAADGPLPPPAAAGDAADAAPAGVEPPAPGGARRGVRLRDRSSILKRYVLDTEPRPGQPGAIRARRLARAV